MTDRQTIRPKTSHDVAHDICLRSILLLGIIPNIGEPMTKSGWDSATKLAELLQEWRQLRQQEGY